MEVLLEVMVNLVLRLVVLKLIILMTVKIKIKNITIKINKKSLDTLNNKFILYIFLFVKEGKYTDKIAIEIQKRILNNVLTNKVKYEKLYKLIMI